MALGLDLAFEPVQHDIMSCHLTPPTIREATEEDRADWAEGTVLIVRLGGDDGWLFPFTAGESDVERILLMADHAQEWVMENDLWPNQPTNWPPCPTHRDGHPLHTQGLGSRAAWVCPASGALVTEIGSFYPTSSEPLGRRYGIAGAPLPSA
jgi:hypothetical protein